jgi:hypothetical protein
MKNRSWSSKLREEEDGAQIARNQSSKAIKHNQRNSRFLLQ